MSVSILKSLPITSRKTAIAESDEQRQWFAYAFPAVLGLLLAVVPVIGWMAKAPFMLVLIPLLLWTAFRDTERAIYIYISWCWIDGTLRGLFDNNGVAIVARDIVLYVVIVGWGFQRLKNRDRNPILAPPGALLIALFVINVLLQIVNPYSLGILQSLAGIKIHLSPIPLFFVAYDVFRRPGQVRSLAIFLTLITLAIACVSLVQYIHGKAWTFAHYPGSENAISTNFNPSSHTHLTADATFKPPGTTMFGGATASFVALVFPLTYALILFSEKLRYQRWLKMACVVVLLVFTVAIFVNGQRSALFEAGACVFACSLFVGGKTRLRAIVAMIICVIIGMAGLTLSESISHGGVADRFATTFEDPDRALSSDRQSFFDQGLTLIVDSPFGVGLGRTGAAAGHLGRAADDLGFSAYSESYFGVMILETGIIGALLITLIAISFVVRGWMNLKRLKNPDDKIIGASMLSVLFILLLNFFFASVLVIPPGSVLFWLFAAVLLRTYSRSEKIKSLAEIRGSV